MPSIKVQVKGLDELIRNFDTASDQFTTVMKSALTTSVKSIRKRALLESKGSKDTGKLQRNIRQEVRGLVGSVTAGSKHSIFIEEGTKPHFPPVAPLEAWAKRKLGKSGLGFVIARKIAREGTEAQPFMQPAADKSKSDVNKFFNNAVDDLIRIMAK